MKRTFRLGASAAIATLALSLSACSGGDSLEATNESSDGPLKMTVSLLPIMDVLPVQLAIQEGIFEKHGLEVEAVPAQSGAGLVPAVLEGSVDVAFGSLMTYLLAMEKGLPLDIVFLGGAEERPEGEPGGEHTASVLMVAEDSPIDSPADLSGKIVSVNAVGNLQEVAVKTAIANAGGDPANVELLELPLSQAQGAVDSGRVDAASVNDPFTTAMLEAGMRPIGDTVKEIDGTNVNYELYFTSTEFADANPEALEAFRAALDEAMDIINEDIDAAREGLMAYTEIDPAVIDRMPIHDFQKDISKDEIAAFIDAATKAGVLEEGDKVTPEKVMENTPTLGKE